ncbi:RNase J family beta-CASP ribonuclease [Methanocella arvoryzae]|uniref:Ribonuclease J n=1 Tax=Methanocella arvoryzae (strain DSM 22066 / NBRC 105507 / MRE50) TaxID=351160 RepID=Q0W8D5_METAR|nr:RNase J family beta-CASP ribonuclease [Methanocella arvoryzae]CAJ35358.1 metallo-beta-lactamase [Methanocella arvoryzae MRE50]
MKDVGIIAVGGYEEVGRNMTAIRVGKDIVVMDMGVRLDRIQIHEETEIEKMHSLDLIQMGAIPDDKIMNNVDGNVIGIVCSHGHLDHIGAVPKLAHRYKCPIIGTPFTAELIRQEIESERKFDVANKVNDLPCGQIMELSKNISIELIRVQHSIIDCAFVAVHTPSGVILYACDFKIDRTPVIGEAPDFKRLKQIGKEGVLAMITESTNVNRSGKTPSEKVARDLVWDALLGTEETESGVLVTTFSSHIARLKSIIEAAEKMNRIPVLLGNSMERYYGTALKMGYVKKPDNLRIFGYRKSIVKEVKRMMDDGKEKYLPIITGHQGEPGAILGRIASGELDYKLESGDKIIFSANVIPNQLNMANRYSLETKLKMKGARIYDNVHVSGHAYKEDHWELLRMVKPEHVIPAHGTLEMHSAYAEMAEDTGYEFGQTVHILRNGQELSL